MGTGDKHMPNVMHPRKMRQHTEVVEKKAGRTLTPQRQPKTALKVDWTHFKFFWRIKDKRKNHLIVIFQVNVSPVDSIKHT